MSKTCNLPREEREKINREAAKLLKSMGIKMFANGCSCCENPYVYLEYQGKIYLDGSGYNNFDTDEVESA